MTGATNGAMSRKKRLSKMLLLGVRRAKKLSQDPEGHRKSLEALESTTGMVLEIKKPYMFLPIINAGEEMTSSLQCRELSGTP